MLKSSVVTPRQVVSVREGQPNAYIQQRAGVRCTTVPLLSPKAKPLLSIVTASWNSLVQTQRFALGTEKLWKSEWFGQL